MEDDARLTALRGEIGARLKGICSNMSEAELAVLVEAIARNTRKFETRSALWGSRSLRAK